MSTSNNNNTRKQASQRWSMISTSTNTSNNPSLRLANNNNNNSSFKRYSMSSLTHSSLSLDTVTLNSDDTNSLTNSNKNKTHRKTASVEESLVNINIERFSNNNNNNISSGGSAVTMSSSDFMFTSITEDTNTVSSKSLSLDKTKKRYSGYLNDYVSDSGSSNVYGNSQPKYYNSSAMSHSRSISSLSNIIASANSNNNNASSRRMSTNPSSVSLKKGFTIPTSQSNASLSSHLSTTSQSSKSSKWMFWRRKSMMNLSDFVNENDNMNKTPYLNTRSSVNSLQSAKYNLTATNTNNNNLPDGIETNTLHAKSSMDSIKSKIRMKLFQDTQNLDIEKPHLNNNNGSNSPSSNVSSSPLSRIPKRSSFISLKRPSKSNLRNKSSQQSLLRNQNSRESMVTMNANPHTNSSTINRGNGTPTEETINHSFDNNTNYSKHHTFDTHMTGYNQHQNFNTYEGDSDPEIQDERNAIMDNFIKLCYKVDDISRIFHRINSKDIYYQRDTTVVTKGRNKAGNYTISDGLPTICKYLAFDSLDSHKIELILKEIDITKKMTSLLREKMIEQSGNENISLKQISDAYGVSPILNMTLISNIFPEDYTKKNLQIMINKLYEVKQNEGYSCILKIEYFDLGIPLSIFLQKSPKPSSRVISKIFIKILHLLSKLEKIGFQHQDLNLDNIIISSSYNVYIIDYKVCKFQQEINTRLDHPLFYKRDSPHYEVYLEMRKVIPYIQKTGDDFGWCHIIWIKYILSNMLESINNNRDKHYDTLMNWLKFILKHQADLENCRDLISYQKKKK
ncbi:hypothetical protein QEN19_002414 [Hanseniaspora menglaensis]